MEPIRPATTSTTGQRPLVEARALVRRHDGGRVSALAGVDLTIEEGEFVAIIGPSGCGKSTLLQLLGLLDAPDSGTLHWRGAPYAPLADAAAFRARALGFVFQSFHLLPTLDALENVQVPMLEMPWSAAERRRRARELLAAVGLEARAAHRPAELSGGERQRVALARALANEPTLLLADEPTGSLDSASAAQVLALLRALHAQRGMALVVVTHDPDVAAHADRIVRMRDGRVLESLPKVAP